jgi:hypothetical protein
MLDGSPRPAVKKMWILGLKNREAILVKMIFGYLSAYYLIYGAPPILLSRARICKPFKEPRNRFPAWRNLFLGFDSWAPNTGSAGWEQKDNFLLGLTYRVLLQKAQQL